MSCYLTEHKCSLRLLYVRHIINTFKTYFIIEKNVKWNNISKECVPTIEINQICLAQFSKKLINIKTMIQGLLDEICPRGPRKSESGTAVYVCPLNYLDEIVNNTLLSTGEQWTVMTTIRDCYIFSFYRFRLMTQ